MQKIQLPSQKITQIGLFSTMTSSELREFCVLERQAMNENSVYVLLPIGKEGKVAGEGDKREQPDCLRSREFRVLPKGLIL
jgi:hypothetical protein